MVDETIETRIWSGIHFRKAEVDGAKIGRDVAKWREHHFFKPVHGHDEDDDE